MRQVRSGRVAPTIDSATETAIVGILSPVLRGRRVGLVSLAHLRRLLPDAVLAGVPVSTPTAGQSQSTAAADLDVILSADAPALAAYHADAHPGLVLIYLGSRAPDLVLPAAAYRQHVLLQPVVGMLAADAMFAGQQAVRLREAIDAEQATVHLLLWSTSPLPDLPLGLHRHVGERPVVTPIKAAPMTVMPLSRVGVDQAPRRAAVALAQRLQAMEATMLTLRVDNRRLQVAAEASRGATVLAAAFDVPRTRHAWVLAETPAADPAVLGLYDRRPDDAMMVEARAGESFFATYRLDGDAPDFSGAVAALNARSPVLDIRAEPDVSIVIPVYGQLAYTLNAVDSLSRHASHWSAEIIIIDDCSPDGVTSEFVPQIGHVRYHRPSRNGGFISSCNIGGRLARGRFVVMLNSDTRVVDGWLDALLDSFTIFPRAGLVGSKMLYPDGMLQEAGGIIWRSGDAWNYGRGDDPNRPQYCHARQVDYISGCSLALPTSLWTTLGGFDPHYTPAYAEDADLCQRVVRAGCEVWYQPLSRVVHYEGKTSGTDTGVGTKAYQVINLKKLFVRWRTRFESHRRSADNVFLERERDVRRRILFVDSVTPTPDQDAGSLQTVLALQCAGMSGYKPYFVPEDNWLFVPHYTPLLQQAGVECSYAPYEVGFENYIRRYGWLFDIVIVFRVQVMDRCISLLRVHAPQAAVAFHVADLHYLRMQRQAAMDDSEAGRLAASDMRERELSNIEQADCTITHSTVEAEILAEAVPDARVVVWPLMVEFVGTNIGFAERRDICFLGGYRHPPNVDAVLYFVQQVFPLLRRAEPGLRFIIAGANPTREVEELACDDIIVTGMVPDLKDVFDACRVFVCPLRVGAGAKGKIVSALSHGIPVVSTSVGVEGAGLTDGQNVLVTDQADMMAEQIMRLYHDETLWTDLSIAGQELIKMSFSPTMGIRKLDEVVETAHRRRLGLPNDG